MPGDLTVDQQQKPVVNVPAGYSLNQSSLAANPNGEGTYKMVGPQGQTVQVPFSKVRGAEDVRYQVVPDDLKRYNKDAAAAQPGWSDLLAAWGEKTYPHITAADAQKQLKDVSPSGEHLPHSTEDGPSFSLPYVDKILAPIEVPVNEFGENIVNDLTRFATSVPAMASHGLNHLLSPSQWEIWDPDSWTPAGHQLKQQKEVETALASGQGRVLAPGERPPEPTAEMWNDYASEHIAGLIKMWGAGKVLEPVLGLAGKDLSYEQTASSGLRDGARDVMGGSGTPAPSAGTAFSVPFAQIMDSLDESELGKRAPKAQRAAVQAIFQGHPNLRFAMPGGQVGEMPPGDFFTLDSKAQQALKTSVIDPTTGKTLGQGLEVAQQGTDGGGLVTPLGAPAESSSQPAAMPERQAEGSPPNDGVSKGTSTTPATTTPAKNTPLTEDSPQPDAGMDAAVASTPAATTPATPVQTAPETAATPDGQTATGASPQDEGITTSVETNTKKVAGGLATIGGRKPINSRYAGGWHPAGIEFSEQGFPKFGPHAIAEVQVEGLTGDYDKDSAMANDVLRIPSTPKGYTWHHVEDGETMQLVPSGIHRKVRHTGGAAVIRNGGLDKK